MDISQIEISKLIPMNQSNYSKIQRGVQEPNLLQLKRICEILELDPSYLLDLRTNHSISKKDSELLADIKELINKHK